MRSITFSGANRLNMPLAQFPGLNQPKKKEPVTPPAQVDTFLYTSPVLFSGKRKRRKSDSPRATSANVGTSDSQSKRTLQSHPSLDPQFMMEVASKTTPRIGNFKEAQSLNDFSELSGFLQQLRATKYQTREYLLSKDELLNRRGLIFGQWLKMGKEIKERAKRPAISPNSPEYAKQRLFDWEYKYAGACYHLIDLELDRRDHKKLSVKDLEYLKQQVPKWLDDINAYHEERERVIVGSPNTRNPYWLDLEKCSDEELQDEQIQLSDKMTQMEKALPPGANPEEVMSAKKANEYRRLKAKFQVMDCLVDMRSRRKVGNPHQLDADEAEELNRCLSVIEGSDRLPTHLRFLQSLTSEALDNRLLNLTRKFDECRSGLPPDFRLDNPIQWERRRDASRYLAELQLASLEKKRRNEPESLDSETYWSQCHQEKVAHLRILHDYWRRKNEPERLSEDSLQFLDKGASSFFDRSSAGSNGNRTIQFIQDIEDEKKWSFKRLSELASEKKDQINRIKEELCSGDKPQVSPDQNNPLMKVIMGRSLFQDPQLQKKIDELQKLRAIYLVIGDELRRRWICEGHVDLSEKQIAKNLNPMTDHWADLMTDVDS